MPQVGWLRECLELADCECAVSGKNVTPRRRPRPPSRVSQTLTWRPGQRAVFWNTGAAPRLRYVGSTRSTAERAKTLRGQGATAAPPECVGGEGRFTPLARVVASDGSSVGGRIAEVAHFVRLEAEPNFCTLGAYRCSAGATAAAGADLSRALRVYSPETLVGGLRGLQDGLCTALPEIRGAPRRLLCAVLWDVPYEEFGLRRKRTAYRSDFWPAWQKRFEAALARLREACATGARTAAQPQQPKRAPQPAPRKRSRTQGTSGNPNCERCGEPMIGHGWVYHADGSRSRH
jgi:hypothetical protein